MDPDDYHTTTTPDGIPLELPVAGFGTRAAAFIVDLAALIIATYVASALLSYIRNALSFGINSIELEIVIIALYKTLISAFVFFGYFLICDAWLSGQTLGKKAGKIRVVTYDGSPPSFRQALIRNLARFIDFLPGLYLTGILAIALSKRSQRLGDMLSNTIVVRNDFEKKASKALTNWRSPDLWMGVTTYSSGLWHSKINWDVTRVTNADLAVINEFLTRRWSMDGDSRSKLALNILGHIQPKVVMTGSVNDAEQFLEMVSIAKRQR
jgi:uncharacterized RDD family membrane protein YckC